MTKASLDELIERVTSAKYTCSAQRLFTEQDKLEEKKKDASKKAQAVREATSHVDKYIPHSPYSTTCTSIAALLSTAAKLSRARCR